MRWVFILCGVFVLVGCTAHNTYYVDQEHLNQARVANETIAIPALDEDRKSVAVQIAPGSIRSSSRFEPGSSYFLERKNGEVCVRPEDAPPNSNCISLETIIHKESAVARAVGYAIMAPGLFLVIAGVWASTRPVKGDVDNTAFIIIAGAVPTLIGGAFVYFGWPSNNPEVDAPSPGFPSRLGKNRVQPIGLGFRGSF